MTRLLALCLLCWATVTTAQAQPTLGVYFDPEGTQTSLQITTYPKDFTFYVVARGVEAFKSMEFALDYDPSGARNVWWGPNGGYQLDLAGATNLCDPKWVEFCLSVGCTSASEPVVIASVTLQAFSTVEDYTICLRATSLGHGPGSVPCAGSSLQPLLAPYQGCAVVNPVELSTPVGDRSSSWSQVKALYHR